MKQRKQKSSGGRYWLYGQHAVSAALSNEKRHIKRLVATRSGLERLAALVDSAFHPSVDEIDGRQLENLLPPGAVHQGMAAEVSPLASISLEDILAKKERKPLLLLDQVTDPHNVGAILRSAAAFDAGAVLVPSHHAPEEGGVIAKAACGALELVPLVEAGNLAQTIEQLKKAEYWVAGLDGTATQSLHEAKLSRASTALVLGAEGKGLRRLTAERCDLLVKLPISEAMESLNVSNAAAIALYELYRSV